MINFNDLLIDKLGDLTNEALETSRISMNLSEDQFRNFLDEENNKVFGIVDETITDFILDKIDKDYISNWLKTFSENQKTILNEFPEFFHNFFLYIHASNNIFAKIEKDTVGQKVELKEVILFCMLGNLCRMADEIGVLLTIGATKAALTLWRVFYEYSVVGVFLMRHDSDELYQRYADHGHKNVEKQKNSYVKHYEKLKFKNLPDEKLQEIELRSNELKEKYGIDFFNEYAWAKVAFDTNKKKVGFFDIELDAEMNKYRPYYIWASGVVHPTYNSMTDYFKDGKLIIGNITQPNLDFESYTDPAQLTLITFNLFLDYFLYRYSADDEYSTNTMLLKKIIERLKETFPELN